jgi:hypothetical protein
MYLDTASLIDTLHAAHPESLYYLAYSYYDPVTGMESPLGPLLVCSLTTGTWSSDTLSAGQFIFDNFDSSLNPSHIRIYQSVTKTTLPGASDSFVWYGTLEMRAIDGGAVIGNWTDDEVADGLDTADITATQYYTYQILRNWEGAVKVLPPYSYDCQIPFADIVYLRGRLWGVGDPAEPNRLYYSAFDNFATNIFSWNPLDFIVVHEIGNDEFIALVLAEGFGDDAFYALAHNSVWVVDGRGNYERILPPSGSSVGAVSRETIVKDGGIVYFVSPDLKIWALSGTSLGLISEPVADYVDSVFESYSFWTLSTDFYSWGHSLGDEVRWFNDSTGLGMAFDVEHGVWSLCQYGTGAYVPRGSFIYDTLHNGELAITPTHGTELLYTDSGVPFRKANADKTGDSAGTWTEQAIQWKYETPKMGDDGRLYEVQRIETILDARTTGILRYAVYDQDGDSLVSDTFRVNNAEIHHLQFWLPTGASYHALRPSVAFFVTETDSTCTSPPDPICSWRYHNFEIIEMRVHLQDVGVKDVW